MNRFSFTIIGLIVCFGFTASMFVQPTPYDPSTPVSSILMALGDDAPEHYIGTYDSEKLALGKDIVSMGSANMPG